MSLIIKGSTIPRRFKSLHTLGEFPVVLIMDGETVWQAFGNVRNYLIDGTFLVPPGVTIVRLCGVGGGGGGSSTNLLGGASGEIISGTDVPVIPGETINIVIGDGGITDEAGIDSKFGAITLQGGSAGTYQGEGGERVTCGGTHNDGIEVATFFGGQASPFSNGGDGNGADGEYGSGGGAGTVGGTGGKGRITVRWSEGD